MVEIDAEAETDGAETAEVAGTAGIVAKAVETTATVKNNAKYFFIVYGSFVLFSIFEDKDIANICIMQYKVAYFYKLFFYTYIYKTSKTAGATPSDVSRQVVTAFRVRTLCADKCKIKIPKYQEIFIVFR